MDTLVASEGEPDLLQISGGEPTLHPDLLEILAVCRRPEIGRVTMFRGKLGPEKIRKLAGGDRGEMVEQTGQLNPVRRGYVQTWQSGCGEPAWEGDRLRPGRRLITK